MNNSGFVFFIGVVVVSISIGTEFKATYGFAVLGIGLMGMSLLSYLNNGVSTNRGN